MRSHSNRLFALLKQSLTWTIFVNFLLGIINFLAQIWFARMLGVEVVGQYAMLVVLIELAYLPLNFGFNLSVIRHRNDNEIFQAALALMLMQIFGIVLFCGSVLFVFFFVAAHQATILIVPGLFLVVSRIIGILSTIVYAPLESHMQYRFISCTRLSATIFGLSIASIFLLRGWGIYTFVARDFFIAIIFFIIVWIRVQPRFIPNFSKPALRTIWYFTKGVWKLNILERGALRLDYALVGMALGRDALGIYFQVRALIEGVLTFLIMPIQTVLFSYYCNLNNRKLLFSRSIKYGSFFVIILSLLSVLIIVPTSNLMITFVLGEEWSSGALLLPGFVIYAWALLWFENIKVMAISSDLHQSVFWSRILQIICLSILMNPMTKYWGFLGAGTVTGFSATMLTILSVIMCLHGLKEVN